MQYFNSFKKIPCTFIKFEYPCFQHRLLFPLYHCMLHFFKVNNDWLSSQLPNALPKVEPRTTNVQWSLFSLKSRTFGLGQTNWADKFWGVWGIFSQTNSTHFGTVSPLSMFSIIQPLFLQKTKPLYPQPKYLFGIRIWIWIWVAKN